MVDKSVLPGFRFHPTDVELVLYYLKRKIQGRLAQHQAVIAEVDIYKFAPWDLPEKSYLQSKDLEWYFFCPRNNKYSHGNRTNRATDIGYWKPTGQDRPIINKKQTVGMKKTLIFHTGKSPNGTRTDWVVHEYRMEKTDELVSAGFKQDAYVLCRVFEKSGQGPKTGEQYGAPFSEEDWEDEADMNLNNEIYLPSAPVPISEPLQSIAPQASDENTVHHVFYVQNSSVIQPSVLKSLPRCIEVGECSNAQISSRGGDITTLPRCIEVGECSNAQISSRGGPVQCNLPHSFSDGFFLGQLEDILNGPHPQGNANIVPELQLSGLAIPLENTTEEANLYAGTGDLGELDTATHRPMGQDDGFILSEAFNCSDNQDHHPFAEYFDGHYMTLDDFASVNQVNTMELPPLPNGQNLPNATLGSDYYDHFVNSLFINDLQHLHTSNVLLPYIAYPDR